MLQKKIDTQIAAFIRENKNKEWDASRKFCTENTYIEKKGSMITLFVHRTPLFTWNTENDEYSVYLGKEGRVPRKYTYRLNALFFNFFMPFSFYFENHLLIFEYVNSIGYKEKHLVTAGETIWFTKLPREEGVLSLTQDKFKILGYEGPAYEEAFTYKGAHNA